MYNRLNLIAVVCLVVFFVMAKSAANGYLPSYAKYNDLQKNPIVRGR